MDATTTAAFVPAAPRGLFTAAAPARAGRLSPLRVAAPARATRRCARLRMAADGPGQGGGEEDVEETVSLKDLKARLAQAQAAEKAEAAAAAGGGEGSAVVDDTPVDPAEARRIEKEKEIERLRAAEKFIEVDEGKFECTACGYVYVPEKGEPREGIAAGTAFDDVPDSFTCPSCRSPKRRFVSRKKIIAGFAVNQTYGLGSNAMTGGEKSLLIFGALAACALLLLSGYALN